MKEWLCMLVMILMVSSALAQTVQDDALAFLQSAGIEADSVMRIDSEIIVTLMHGGTASLWTYGDFDMYDLSWRFQNAADEDVALYLDHALTLLNTLEQRIPADMSSLTDAEKRRAENYAVMVSNSLLSLENVGQQGLCILLDKLSLHDDSGLNSLRARLASRLLGALDNSPVNPEEGLTWYDALILSVQDDLPLPDASVYVADAFLAEVTQLMIAHEEARRVEYTWGNDVDPAKATTFVYLSAVTCRIENDAVTVFCHMASERYALYDGSRLELLSGGWYPVRIDLLITADGWTLTSVTEPEDGTHYWPSIVAFCDGDEKLAESLCRANTPELHEAHEAALGVWVESIGDLVSE